MAMQVPMVDVAGSHYFSAQCTRKREFDSKIIWMLGERGIDGKGWMKLAGLQRWSGWMQHYGLQRSWAFSRTRKESHLFRGKQDRQ